MSPDRRWAAGCREWLAGPFILEQQAIDRAAQMDHMGHCRLEHTAVELFKNEHGEWRTEDGRQCRGS